MYKNLCTVLLLIFISIQTQAQTGKFNLERRLYPGSVTKADGQVIRGFIFNQGKEDNQRQCLFYTDADDMRTKTVFKPADLVFGCKFYYGCKSKLADDNNWVCAFSNLIDRLPA